MLERCDNLLRAIIVIAFYGTGCLYRARKEVLVAYRRTGIGS